MEMKKFPSSKNLEVSISADIYLFKITNQNTRKRCEICSKLTIKAPEQLHWLRSGVFIVLTWNTFETVFYCFYCWLWTYISLLGKAPTHSTNQRALLFHLCFSPTMTRAIINTSSFEVQLLPLNRYWSTWTILQFSLFLIKFPCSLLITLQTSENL